MKKALFLAPVIAAATLMVGCQDYLCMAPAGTTASSKLTICHVAGKNKFTLITVAASAATAHVDHGDFLAPAGAKKASDCVVPPVVVPPVVTPPVVVPPVVVPPVVVPPVVVPPVVVPPVVVPPVVVPPVVVPPVVVPPVVVPPVVVPPVVVPPVVTPPPTTSDDDGESSTFPGETTPPAAGGGDVTVNPGDLENLPCLTDDSRPECLL